MSSVYCTSVHCIRHNAAVDNVCTIIVVSFGGEAPTNIVQSISFLYGTSPCSYRQYVYSTCMCISVGLVVKDIKTQLH